MTHTAVVGPSEGKGLGVFAVEPIPQGTLIAAFTGFVATTPELESLEPWQHDRCLQIHTDLYLVSTEPEDPPDLINHSCEPNCGFVGTTLLVARNDIAVGEELGFDYAMCDTTPYDEFTCGCRSRSCRRRVSGADWQRPELWSAYRGYFSTHVEQQIMATFGVDVRAEWSAAQPPQLSDDQLRLRSTTADAQS